MKVYYYFLFRIYRYYKDKERESDFQALFGASAVSTVIIYFILLFVYGFVNYLDLLPMIKNKMYVIPFMVGFWFINYHLFVKNKKFLNYGFQKDRKGGVLITIFIVVLGVSFIILSNANRTKIFEERRKNPPVEEMEKKPSLEGEIRKWFEN